MTDHETGPLPEADAERHLAGAVADLHRLRWLVLAAVGAALTVIVAALALLVLQQRGQIRDQQRQVSAAQAQVAADQRQVSADQAQVGGDEQAIDKAEQRLTGSCRFYRDLAILPVRPSPPQKTAAENLVRIVVDARRAWVVQGCPGGLPAPGPSLVKWAHYYGLAIPQAPQG